MHGTTRSLPSGTCGVLANLLLNQRLGFCTYKFSGDHGHPLREAILEERTATLFDLMPSGKRERALRRQAKNMIALRTDTRPGTLNSSTTTISPPL